MQLTKQHSERDQRSQSCVVNKKKIVKEIDEVKRVFMVKSKILKRNVNSKR